MKPAPFEYLAPRTVPEAVSLLARHGEEAKLLAGGQSLVPLMNMRLARPRRVIDLNRTQGLAYIREVDGALRIGGMTRQATLERSPLIGGRCPLLPEALALVGHPAIRRRRLCRRRGTRPRDPPAGRRSSRVGRLSPGGGRCRRAPGAHRGVESHQPWLSATWSASPSTASPSSGSSSRARRSRTSSARTSS